MIQKNKRRQPDCSEKMKKEAVSDQFQQVCQK